MNDLVQAVASKEAGGSLAPEERKLFKKVYKKRVKGWNNFFDKWASHNPEDDKEYEVDEEEDWRLETIFRFELQLPHSNLRGVLWHPQF